MNQPNKIISFNITSVPILYIYAPWINVIVKTGFIIFNSTSQVDALYRGFFNIYK